MNVKTYSQFDKKFAHLRKQQVDLTTIQFIMKKSLADEDLIILFNLLYQSEKYINLM
jgi:hypothetical protein